MPRVRVSFVIETPAEDWNANMRDGLTDKAASELAEWLAELPWQVESVSFTREPDPE